MQYWMYLFYDETELDIPFMVSNSQGVIHGRVLSFALQSDLVCILQLNQSSI